jgi:hypothetical protein
MFPNSAYKMGNLELIHDHGARNNDLIMLLSLTTKLCSLAGCTSCTFVAYNVPLKNN